MDSKDPTQVTQHRYERIARRYDGMQKFAEKVFAPWRKVLWSRVKGKKILEVGVGTGKNFEYYPAGRDIIGIDLTRGMLDIAREKARHQDREVYLREADVQALPFFNQVFDTVIATFVFCSVPDPVKGFQEIKRVLKTGGQVLLLEHMRPNSRVLGKLFDLINPLVSWLMGANINRRTLENIQGAGLHFRLVEDLGWRGMFCLIEVTA